MTALRHPTYVTHPTIALPAGTHVYLGDEVWAQLRTSCQGQSMPVIVIDAYPGVEVDDLVRAAAQNLTGFEIIDCEREAALEARQITRLIEHALTDDRVFGFLTRFDLPEFYDPSRLEQLRDRVRERTAPTVVIGWGAALVAPDADVLVLADLARWEIQRRQRAGAPNWRCHNVGEDPLRKYKRGFFVEWRTADRHKRTLFDRLDFVLDTAKGSGEATMIDGPAFRAGLDAASSAPFRVVPFFDPGVWGGQWMREVIGLDRTPPNYAWCFDCVPEENSLLLEAEGRTVEIPAINLVLARPVELLGRKTFARFGAEFPIRFDFLDTMGGGNLSLQVHPLTDYIQRTFGMHYTQDESYYLLDAGEDAVVYLGLRTGADRDEMERDLRAAQRGEIQFPAEKYVNTFPAAKHDHFSIPAGTVHCSGKDSMVLEISATPYIFTFKMWDWGRVGLDGVPRPVHIDHALANIQWNRDTDWVTENLVGQVESIDTNGDEVEERTGLHELEFIEVRRHWFSESSIRNTDGTVHVLNLVEGDEVEVVSPDGAFEPYVVHYAETFIVPARVGEYVVRKTAASESTRFGTVTAFVRNTRLSCGDETPVSVGLPVDC